MLIQLSNSYLVTVAMAQSYLYLSNGYLATIEANHIVVMLQGICHYVNTSCHVLPIETYHTILANQISITDFC